MFGMISAIALIAMPASMLVAGFLIQAAGLRAMLIIIAAAFSLITVAVVANPTLRELDVRAKTAPAETAAGVEAPG
jgi:MFS family permease